MAEDPQQRRARLADASATERADELLEIFGQRLGRLLIASAHGARRLAALAREEAEDMWAEAQGIAHGNGAHPVIQAKVSRIEEIPSPASDTEQATHHEAEHAQ